MMGEVAQTRMAKLKPLKTLAVAFVNTLLVASALAWNVQSALAQTAALVPNAKQQFFNANGQPLVGGSVYSYVPNTTTPKTTWVDPFETTPNANPVVLDAGGGAFIFGQGNYRQIVKDAQGNLIWDGFTSAYGSSAPSGANGTDTAPVGTVMPFAGSAVPVNWQLAFGQALSRSTFAQLETAITIATSTGNATSTSTTISGFTSTAQVPVGAPIECSCLPTGTTVASITNATTLVVSQAATATGTFTVTVFPWGNGDGVSTFNVPDLRGRTFAGADAMGGTAASRLTSTFYGASAGVPGVAGGAQSNTASTTLVAGNIPQVSTSYTPAGTVAITGGTIGGTSSITADLTAGSAEGPWPTNSTNISAGFTGTPATITVGNASPSAATSAAFGVIQPTLTVNYIIKVAPNTTGAGGVTSLGGMFGDIVCGAGLTCAPVAGANTIAVTSVPATSLIVDTTLVTGGCTGGVLWQNFTVQSLCPVVGGVYSVSGGSVPQVSTTLPNGLAMGTPSSLILTNATGLPLGSGVNGLLPLANGGTNANLTPNAGGVIYSTASALDVLNNPNSNGECLLSGTSAPTWGSCSGAAPAVATVGNAAADTTLTVAGTGTGPWDGNVTVALNLANANTWTATQSFVGNGSAANVILDTAGAGVLETIHLKDNGVIKWQIEKDNVNNFIIHDQSAARNDLLIAPNGDMSLMPSGGAVSTGGNIYIGGGSPYSDIRAEGALGNAGSSVTVTAASPAVVTWTGHGASANQKVVFLGGTLPTGLTVGTVYFVVGGSITTNTFEVSATSGGAPINTSGSASSGVTAGLDDHAAIASSIANVLATATGSGEIFFPPGHYCDMEGTDVTGHSSSGLVFSGVSTDTSIWDVCDQDVTLIAYGGLEQTVQNLTLNGDPFISGTHPTVSVGTGCSSQWTCLLQNVLVQYGYQGVVNASQLTIAHSRIIFAYGDYVNTVGGLNIHDSQIDTANPPGPCNTGGFPGAQTVSIVSWTASTNYQGCKSIILVGSGATAYCMIAGNNGTSGTGPAPVAASWNVPVAEGTINWYTLGNCSSSNGNGVHAIASPAFGNVTISGGTDISGSFVNGIKWDGGSGLRVTDTTIGLNLASGVNLTGGGTVFLSHVQFYNGLEVGSIGVQTNISFTSKLITVGNTFTNWGYGQWWAAGQDLKSSSNIYNGNNIGLNVTNNLNVVSIIGDTFDGNNSQDIQFNGGTTTNFSTIVGNICGHAIVNSPAGNPGVAVSGNGGC